MTNTKIASPSVKFGYSDDYKRIRNDAEQNWPELKIAAYNENFAISIHAKKLISTK